MRTTTTCVLLLLANCADDRARSGPMIGHWSVTIARRGDINGPCAASPLAVSLDFGDAMSINFSDGARLNTDWTDAAGDGFMSMGNAKAFTNGATWQMRSAEGGWIVDSHTGARVEFATLLTLVSVPSGDACQSEIWMEHE